MLGTKIKQLRELLGKTQEDIAAQLHITPQAYSRIERNEVSISLERLEQIAQVLGIKSHVIADFDPLKYLQQLNAPTTQLLPNIQIVLDDKPQTETIKLLSKIIEEQHQEIRNLRNELYKSYNFFKLNQRPSQNEATHEMT